MTFQTFINNIINCYNSFFGFITSIINPILNNNFVKLIIFVVLIYLGVEFIDKIIATILNIFSQKKSLSKEKTTNKNTDIE